MVVALSSPFGPSPCFRVLRPLLTSRSASRRRPFRRKARSPQVRPSAFRARPPDLRRSPSVAGASRPFARSPRSATPHIRFLFVGPLLSLRASSGHPLAELPLRFAQVGATSSLPDSHRVAETHAGRTRRRPRGSRPKSFVLFGRDGGIRTRDPLNPIQVRYQAAPRPDRVTSEGRGSIRARAGSSSARAGGFLLGSRPWCQA